MYRSFLDVETVPIITKWFECEICHEKFPSDHARQIHQACDGMVKCRKRSWSTYLSDTTVTIRVGPSKRPFVAHRSLLCDASPFFEKAPSFRFKEATEGCVDLPEERPHIFAHFLTWAYGGNYRTDTNCSKHSLLRLWILADRLFVPKLQTDIVQALTAASWHFLPSFFPRMIADLYSQTAPDSSLRLLLADVVASVFTKCTFDQIKDEFDKEFLQDLCKAMLSLEPGSEKPLVSTRYRVKDPSTSEGTTKSDVVLDTPLASNKLRDNLVLESEDEEGQSDEDGL